jgi:hypothetical protein
MSYSENIKAKSQTGSTTLNKNTHTRIRKFNTHDQRIISSLPTQVSETDKVIYKSASSEVQNCLPRNQNRRTISYQERGFTAVGWNKSCCYDLRLNPCVLRSLKHDVLNRLWFSVLQKHIHNFMGDYQHFGESWCSRFSRKIPVSFCISGVTLWYSWFKWGYSHRDVSLGSLSRCTEVGTPCISVEEPKILYPEDGGVKSFRNIISPLQLP